MTTRFKELPDQVDYIIGCAGFQEGQIFATQRPRPKFGDHEEEGQIHRQDRPSQQQHYATGQSAAGGHRAAGEKVHHPRSDTSGRLDRIADRLAQGGILKELFESGPILLQPGKKPFPELWNLFQQVA